MTRSQAIHPLAELRTIYTTDDQWLALLHLIGDDDGPFKVEFPSPGQASVRVILPDGEGVVIKDTGEVWHGKDLT